MQRTPTNAAYPYADPDPQQEGERPMTMLEAALFFGVLVVILDAIGAVIGRATGLNIPVCVCGNVFLYAAAGFVAARYTATINGVWAGIMAAALDTIFGQLVFMAILPGYREMIMSSAESQQMIPVGVLAIVLVLYVFGATIATVIVGAFWGFLGAAVAQLKPFRPAVHYVEEY
jgi:hypothetical protein